MIGEVMTTETKTCAEMNFKEFHEWATRVACDAIITGGFNDLKSVLFTVIDAAARNKVFGGEKPKKN